MGFVFAWPNELERMTPGLALTFVVPARECNLSCSFCAIRQRKEALFRTLEPSDYVDFLEQVAAVRRTTIVAIQGYEPLLEEAWPYTQAIFEAANRLGLRTSLVTNGVTLMERAAALAFLRPSGITVSLDADRAVDHDRIRGRVGAFEATTRGLREFMRLKGEKTRVTVNSVMLPRRRRLLEHMPEILAEMGVSHWTVTPVLRIGRDGAGGPVEDTRSVVGNLIALRDRAAEFGVEVALYDELGRITASGVDFADLLVHVFERPDGLVRLSPSGACSVGYEILQEVGPHTPVWRPGEISPALFLDRILNRIQAHVPEAA